MHSRFPALFSEGAIGRMKLANRIVMAPISTNFASASGSITDHMVKYYARRAQGGAGLIIVESSNVDFPSGKSGATQLRLDDKQFLPGLNYLTETVHLYGAAIAIQLNHAGAAADSDDLVAPSRISADRFPQNVRELTIGEIEKITEKFVVAAKIAKMAGFDAVEIHGAHGYLLSQFMSPFTNERKDIYGGTLENRMRLPVAIVKAIRNEVGNELAIIFRLNGDEFISGGAEIDEIIQRARLLEQAGVDAIHVSAGVPWTMVSRIRMVEPMSFPQGWKVYLAKKIKDAVSIPVIAVGTIREPTRAEEILTENGIDFVALGRALIADPDWPRKAREGKADRIRHCISCMECLKRRSFEFLPIKCTVNPEVGQFRAARIDGHNGSEKPKKVIVAGGGPAGMMAASLLAQKGHSVTLYEQTSQLGGQLNVACLPPGKEKIAWLRQYLINEVTESKVRVELGKRVDEEVIRREKPDVLIVACGSEEVWPPFASAGRTGVVLARQALREPPTEKQVVVVGGGSVGCETALLLSKSNRVTVVEMLDHCASDLDPVSRFDLLSRLEEAQVTVINRAKVIGIRLEGVEIEFDGTSQLIPGDYIVIAVGATPTALGDLREPVPEYYVIGDSKKPGKIYQAIHDAFRISLMI